MSAHEDFRSSLLKYCQTALLGMEADGITTGAQVVDFDSAAQMDDLPKVDLLGICNLHWVKSGLFYTVIASICVSTWDDTNNFRHNKIVGFLDDNLDVARTIPLVDSTTGARAGWLVLQDGIGLVPMLALKDRSVQSLMLSFQTSRT